MSQTCNYCHKPLSECREADKQLITPFNPDNCHDMPFFPTTRDVVAAKYKLGCYNPDNRQFYIYHRSITQRMMLDVEMELPKCVWEKNTYSLCCRMDMVCDANVKSLPIESEYITILKSLSSYEIYREYM